MDISNLTGRRYPLPAQPQQTAEALPAVHGPRQDTAAAANAQNTDGKQNQQGQQQTQTSAESFVQKMFEQMLANRLGIDKEKLDEIKEKMEQIEKEKQALQQQGPLDAKGQQQLQALDDKLAALEQAMQDLLKEANERRNQHQDGPQKVNQQLASYRYIARY
ncbi:hypothetical protein [Bowmanella dokdonensis]|uniref:Uncharacterized protein n=1 Tax=Bowmanella dokdonensis TaxID=751969 RepID=A0A939DSL1_9ALTE|nr:hypothetical protein [Bowmanella dokdonensis]MBN7827181.1 hypothetical protein [Bowmanella dokdonensis]